VLTRNALHVIARQTQIDNLERYKYQWSVVDGLSDAYVIAAPRRYTALV